MSAHQPIGRDGDGGGTGVGVNRLLKTNPKRLARAA